jgi:hypothetical protein
MLGQIGLEATYSIFSSTQRENSFLYGVELSTFKTIHMHQILNTIHSYNRYLLLAVLLFVVIKSLLGWLGKKPYEAADRAAGGALVGLAHLQLLVGLIQYFFTSAYTRAAFADMGAAMKDANLRYFAVEHITTMMIAVVLIQLGRTLSKRRTGDTAKHRTVAIYSGIALLLIVGTLASKGILVGSLGDN